VADDGPHIAQRTDAQQLLRIWLSPSFPVGAFAYSHGLEAAVARGLIASRADLEAWLRALLQQGSARTDLVLLAAVHAAEPAALPDINALALALQPSAERYLETSQQGGSFVATCLAVWPCNALTALRAQCPDAIAYSVALGTAAAGHGIALTPVLQAAALAFVQNLVSAAIRLSVIGQTDGQRVTAALMPDIAASAHFAETATLHDLGAACFSSDLASLEHETLGTRLFRS
jgi:urease accessory protein